MSKLKKKRDVMEKMIEAERIVIGSILIDSSVLYDLYGHLPPEAFTVDILRDAYTELLVMYDTAKPINMIELAAKLESAKYSKETILCEIRKCINDVPTSAWVASAAQELNNEYKSAKVRRIFQSVSLKADDIDNTISHCINELEALLEVRENTCRSLREVVRDNKDNYFVDKANDGIKTGFYMLDDALGVLEGGDVTVIGARPATGKSALVTQIIGNVASKGYKVGFFNLEMRESQVYERFVANMSQIELTRIRRAKAFLKGEEEKFSKANNKLEKLNVVLSTGSKSISTIKKECRHQQFDLIVIDYLQLVIADKKYANRASEVGDISKATKAMAMELNVPVILLSQLNRTSESRNTKEPEMSELRESGDIEQDASNILLLWNLADDNPRAKGLKIAKCRQGEPIKIGLEFSGSTMQFDERQEGFSKYYTRIKNEKRSSYDELTPFDGGDW